MIEIEYEVGASKAELRELFVAEVDDEALVQAHDGPWLGRGLQPPRRSVKRLRADALASFLDHASREAAECVLTVREAAPWLGLSPRQLRHDVDQGRYDEQLTTTRDGLRALRFEETVRTWRLPPARRPDPRVFVWVGQSGRLGRVAPGETFADGYTRRSDGLNWKETW
jgi:hypothetical protein